MERNNGTDKATICKQHVARVHRRLGLTQSDRNCPPSPPNPYNLGHKVVSPLIHGVMLLGAALSSVPSIAWPTHHRYVSLVPRLHPQAFYRTVYKSFYTRCDKKLGGGVWERG